MDESPIGRVGCGSRSRSRKINRLRRIVAAAARSSSPSSSARLPSMPLSAPASPRTRLHSRRVTYEGWQRDDGLFDIEGHLVDIKDHDTNLLSGVRPAGEPVHDMWVRVTIDTGFTVTAIEAQSDRVPYPGGCDQIGPDYRVLVGANPLDLLPVGLLHAQRLVQQLVVLGHVLSPASLYSRRTSA